MRKPLVSANIITLLRISGTAVLLFLRPFSPAFFVVYTLTGVTDVLDGFVARKTGTASDFGAKLDSVADLIFYGVMLLKIFPVLWDTLPKKIWWGVALVLFLRVCSYTTAAIRYHRFASLHTYLNKLTGASIFCVPYFLPASFGVVYCFGVCVVALLAVIEELTLHLLPHGYGAGRKSIFLKPRPSPFASEAAPDSNNSVEEKGANS